MEPEIKQTTLTDNPVQSVAIEPPDMPATLETPPEQAPEIPQTETAKEESIEENQKDADETRLSSRFVALTHKERQLQERERALQEKEAKLSAIDEAKKKAKIDPLKLLEEHGLSYEDVTRFILDDKKPIVDPEVLNLKETVNSLTKKMEDQAAEQEKKRAEEELTYIDRTKTNFKAHIKKTLTADADKWELINVNDAYDVVFDVMEEYYNEHGALPPLEDAAKQVEEHLYNQGQKFLKAKKLAPPKAETKTMEKPISTLTNKATASSSVMLTPKHLSREQSLKEAAKLLRWNN